MVVERKNYPGDYIRKRHLMFVRANWRLLAREAYRGFLRSGRGMVIVDNDDFVRMPVGVVVGFKLAYIAEGRPELTALGGWPGDKEARWVREYDPSTTMLVGVCRQDGGISSYRVQGVGDEIPEKLYKQDGDQDDDRNPRKRMG